MFVRTRQNTHKCCAMRNIITGAFNAAVLSFPTTAVPFQASPYAYSLQFNIALKFAIRGLKWFTRYEGRSLVSHITITD